MNAKRNGNTKNAMTTSTRTAQLITAARQAQAMSLRDFGKALNVSQTQVQNYENGQEPDRARVASWIESDVPWVHQLGLEIFGAQFAEIVHAVLVPSNGKILSGQKAGSN